VNIPRLLSQEEVFGSAYAAAVYLSSVLNFPKDKRVYVIGMSGLEDELRDEGISFIGGTVSITSPVILSMRISFPVLRTLQITPSLHPAKYHPIPRLAPCWLGSIRPLTTRSCLARSATCTLTLHAHFSPPIRIPLSHRTRVCFPVQAPSLLPFSPRWVLIGQSPRSESRAG